jgi:hypothetical protein
MRQPGHRYRGNAHNSDPVFIALDAARDRWLSTRDASAVRLLLLDALRAMEG